VDHRGFEVEAAVADVEDGVWGFGGCGGEEVRGGTAEDFAAGERRDLRDKNRAALGAQGGGQAVDRGVELDCADESEVGGGLEVALDGSEEVGDVDANINEDIKGFDRRDRDGDQAAVGVVHEEVAAQGSRCVVVDAACAVRYVAHYQGRGAGAEAC